MSNTALASFELEGDVTDTFIFIGCKINKEGGSEADIRRLALLKAARNKPSHRRLGHSMDEEEGMKRSSKQ